MGGKSISQALRRGYRSVIVVGVKVVVVSGSLSISREARTEPSDLLLSSDPLSLPPKLGMSGSYQVG